MANLLKDRVAVVTGSGRGIGRAIALAMAKEGARIVTNNRKPDGVGDAETTAREIKDMGGQAVPFYGDISSFETGRKLIQTAVDSFGKLDILVNNAGFRDVVDSWEITEEQWDRVIGIILKGTFNCTRHALPLMKEQRWGRIINCASGCWILCLQACHYGAAKAAVVGFTRAIAGDMATHGITCNAYHPVALTAMSTDFERTKSLFGKRYEMGLISKEDYENVLSRPGPEGVGSLVTYLATDAAAKINGKVLYASGGMISIYSEPEKIRTINKKGSIWTVEELIEKVPKELLLEDKKGSC